MTINRKDERIDENITYGEFSEILEKGGIKLRKLVVGKKSLLDGVQLKNTNLPKNVLIGPLLKGDSVILPDGNTVLQRGDTLVLLGNEEDLFLTRKQLEGVSMIRRIKIFFAKIFKRNKEYVE